jgi:hypothetical protein
MTRRTKRFLLCPWEGNEKDEKEEGVAAQLGIHMTDTKSTSEKKLEALSQRVAESRAALLAQKNKLKMLGQKNDDRLTGIAGRAVLRNAKQSPEFKQFLLGVLRTTVTDESEKKFLRSQDFYD